MTSDQPIVVLEKVEDYLPQDQAEEINRTVKELDRQSTELVVFDAATQTQAAEIMGRARQKQKAIESFRYALVNPFNEQIRRINSFFKRTSELYDPIVQRASKKLMDFQRSEELRIAKARAEEQKKLAESNKKTTEKAKEKGIDPAVAQRAPEIAPAPTTIVAASTRVQFREVRVYEIKPEAKQNPCKYFTPEYIRLDEEKLAAAVRHKILEPGSYRWGRVFIDKQPIAVKL
jgi:hypothetical protein